MALNLYLIIREDFPEEMMSNEIKIGGVWRGFQVERGEKSRNK